MNAVQLVLERCSGKLENLKSSGAPNDLPGVKEQQNMVKVLVSKDKGPPHDQCLINITSCKVLYQNVSCYLSWITLLTVKLVFWRELRHFHAR